MKWKDNAHLFVNGKFKVLTQDIEMNIIGCTKVKNATNIIFILEHDKGGKIKESPDSCTLISRKISDLTDEELIEVFQDYNFDFELTSVKWNSEGYFTIKTGNSPSFIQYLYPDKFRFQLVLNLLNKGVYPFSQEHFETGEVIDANQ